MSIINRTLDYWHDGIRHEGYLAYDDSRQGPLSGLLISPTWAGRDSFACDKAHQLAEMGFAALALDLYGEGKVGNSPEENARLMEPLMKDRNQLLERMQAALATFREQPEIDPHRIGAIGYCFGGLCVLDLARSGVDIRGVVSFHGLLTPPSPPPRNPIKAKILVLHGFDDPMGPPEQMVALGHELNQAGADWQIHAYGRTVHAFTNPAANNPGFGTVYNETADRRSWQALQTFLTEVLR